MDTSNLMSSIREMITAETNIVVLEKGCLDLDPSTKNKLLESYRTHFSLHEQVVREGLQRLADLAAAYKKPPRFGR